MAAVMVASMFGAGVAVTDVEAASAVASIAASTVCLILGVGEISSRVAGAVIGAVPPDPLHAINANRSAVVTPEGNCQPVPCPLTT